MMKLFILFLLCIGITLTYENIIVDDEVVVHAKLQSVGYNQEVDQAEGDDQVDDEDEFDENDEDDDLLDLGDFLEDNTEVKEHDDVTADDDEEDDTTANEFDITENEKVPILCENVSCKKGMECVVLNGEATCRCVTSCPPAAADDEKICGSDNETYANHCELWRTKCLYLRDNVKGAKHLRVSYYGSCKALPKCRKSELKDFPLRMRSWLKNVYLQLYDEDEAVGGLGSKHRNPGRRLAANRERLREFEQGSIELMQNDIDKYLPLYSYPIHWKFINLDIDPVDKYLSRSELEPLVATLIPLERCTRAFFKAADVDQDRRISLVEWGLAMGLHKDDMDMNVEL